MQRKPVPLSPVAGPLALLPLPLALLPLALLPLALLPLPLHVPLPLALPGLLQRRGAECPLWLEEAEPSLPSQLGTMHLCLAHEPLCLVEEELQESLEEEDELVV